MSWKNDQVSEAETAKILSLAREALAAEGDFVEFGCYAGDTSLLLAEALRGRAKLYLYDSFEGLPIKTIEDTSALGDNFVPGALSVSKKDVKARFLRAGLPVPIIKKAWFSDLAATDLPDKIAFAFLDGDLYNSIKDSFTLITPHLSSNAIIVVHDYSNPALPGVAKATDEWLTAHSCRTAKYQSMMIIRI